MTSPQIWTLEQLTNDAQKAREVFRLERTEEPLALYSQHYKTFATIFDNLIERMPELRSPEVNTDAIAQLMADDDRRRAFCYLAAPPISEDDLKTLAETSLAPGVLRQHPENAARLRDTIFRILDPHRFPWIAENRQPTPNEKAAAIVASAALVAVRKVETFRRNDAKDKQENKVKQLLIDVGFKEVPKQPIPNAAAAPQRGTFMGETALAGTKADVVATLHDGRILAVECKVSNSAVNSYKRLVHDTGGKATIWYRDLGRLTVISAAVLSGVFNPANCLDVQNNKNVYLFWDYRLDDLRKYLEKARQTQ